MPFEKTELSSIEASVVLALYILLFMLSCFYLSSQ